MAAIDVPPPVITRAPDGARDGLIDTGERLVWVGAVEEAEGAPRARVVFPVEATHTLRQALEARDAKLLGELIASMPLPFGTLRALALMLGEAARPLAEGRLLTNGRWQRVLATVLAGRDPPALPQPTRAPLPALDDGLVVQAAATGGESVLLRVRSNDHETLARVRGGEVTRLQRFALGPGDSLELLSPVDAPSGCTVAAVLFRAGPRHAHAWAFGADGEVRASAALRCPSRPFRFSLREDRLWLHLRAQHVCAIASPGDRGLVVTDEVPPNAREEPRPTENAHVFGPIACLDGWLLVYRGVTTRNPPRADELRWVDLGGRNEDRTLPWYQELRAVVPKPDRVWVSSARGVWGLHPLAPSLFRWAHAPGTLDVDGDELWMSFRNAARDEAGVMAVHLPTSHERWRVGLAWTPHEVLHVPGALIIQVGDWTLVDDARGEVILRGPGHHELQALSAGTRALIAAGHELLFLDGGKLVRRLPFGCRLHLGGLTHRSHAVVELEGRGLLLFALDGTVAGALLSGPPGELPPSLRSAAWTDPARRAAVVSSGHLWLREGGALTRLDVEDHRGEPWLPAHALHLARDEERRSDDDAALSVANERLCAFGCRYLGGDGAAALSIGEGCFATLIGGALSGGVSVEAGATLVLFDVDESAVDEWELDAGAFVIRLSAA